MGMTLPMLSILKRHGWAALVAFVSVLGSSYVYLLLTPPLYQASTRLKVDEKRGSISELGQALARLPENTPGGPSPIATQAEIIKSRRVLQRALDQVAVQNTLGNLPLPTTEKILQKLKIKIIPATSILELSYQSTDPNLASQLLNSISASMVQESAESIRLEASSVRKFLEERIPQQEAKLANADQQESDYRRESGLVSPENQTQSLVTGLASVEDQVRTLSSQVQEARTRSSLLQQVTGVQLGNAYASARAGQDEVLKNLRTRLAEFETKVIDSRSRLGDQNPDLLAAIEQRDKVQELYAQRLAQVVPGNQQVLPGREAGDDVSRDLVSRYITNEVERNALESKLQTMSAERAKLQARISVLPGAQQKLTDLVRQREEAATTLKLLQSKLEEARVAEAQLISNVQIVDSADVPKTPSSAKLPTALAVAIPAGLFLSVALILLLEVVDNTVRSASEAEALLKLPVLGRLRKLPEVHNLQQLERFLNTLSQSEPYRMLLKTLDFSSNKAKVFVVSSSCRGEGKSNVVARLSALAASLCRRTLIIDADLRQPIQHKFFDLPAQPEFANALKGKPLLDCARETQLENLSVLTHISSVGVTGLLETSAMKSLIAEASEHYDLILIDATPTEGCADAVTLSQYADAILLVVRPNSTAKEVISRATAELQKSSTHILGIVINETPDPQSRNASGNFAGFYQPSSVSLKSLPYQDTAPYNSEVNSKR